MTTGNSLTPFVDLIPDRAAYRTLYTSVVSSVRCPASRRSLSLKLRVNLPRVVLSIGHYVLIGHPAHADAGISKAAI